MERLSFKLEVFEGPLDLMLSLINKHRLNINDIEISKLLEQYISYINDCQSHDLELAGEFLDMASRLIYIKTVSLLPNSQEAERVKKELEGTLIEYSLCKQATETLKELFCGDKIFSHRRIVESKVDNTYNIVHSPDVLLNAYMNIGLKRLKRVKPVITQDRFQVIVKHKMYPIEIKVVSVLRTMYKYGKAKLSDLLDGIDDRSERVALFLAVLELTKSGRLLISDDSEEISFTGRKQRNSKSMN
ncbi:MAG: segregation/condensation protein A [Ruminococcus sp.]|nr:segregation/condensation protein A [Ruminococcus sp.]